MQEEKTTPKVIRVVAAVIVRGGRICATQRGSGAYKDGWEFPGGKVEPGETPAEALVREIREELDVLVEVGAPLVTVEHDYPGFHLSMDCFWCTLPEHAADRTEIGEDRAGDGAALAGNWPDRTGNGAELAGYGPEASGPQQPRLLEHEALRWLTPAQLWDVDWLPADVKVVQAIERAMRGEMPEELFDVCDVNGLPTGEVVTRSAAHRDGILHRTAHIWVIRREGDRIRVLLQKRSMDKDSFPGMYDTSSAGHIQAGDEPLVSAQRELEEELGIRALPEDLHFAGNCRITFEGIFHGSLFREDEIVYLYVYERPVRTEDIHIQEEELECVEWFDLEDVVREVSQGTDRMCVPPEGLELLEGYLERSGSHL